MPRQPSKIIPYEMRKLGAYLKELREGAGLSIRKVAKQVDLAPSYLSKIEKGDFSTINIHAVLKLSEFYNIPIGALLKEVGFIDSDEYDLPDLPQYLRAKYHLPPQAIRDMQMAKEIVEKKYSPR